MVIPIIPKSIINTDTELDGVIVKNKFANKISSYMTERLKQGSILNHKVFGAKPPDYKKGIKN
jgi:hypothetical protein